MKKAFLTIALAVVPSVLLIAARPAAPQSAASMKAFLDTYCVSCHNRESSVANLSLEGEVSQIGQNREVWEKVVLKLKSGQEPKTSITGVKLEPAKRKEIVAWLEAELDRNAPAYTPPPGLHRLNRTEYGNAIKDLFDLDIVPSTLLPEDDSTHGFDNIAGALRTTPELAAAYLKVATTISHNVVTSGTGTAIGKKLWVCRPTATSDTDCARRIITNIVTHAYRKPASADDVNALMEIYQSRRRDVVNTPYYFRPPGAFEPFETGIESALREILTDRKFLYRREVEPPNLTAGQTYHISDLELASRLSYFLWSRGPDDSLLDLAARGQLRDPSVLEREARRMLADPRAEALTKNFAGQWLNLRSLEYVKSQPMYPDFDEPLRAAMRRESELFFESIVREDRNILDLLTANYTFVNDRLARHYGIPNITGSEFRRITLEPAFDVRRGLLGKASFQTITSFPDRTSLAVRGKWVLRQILGVSAPDPPPNVPPLKIWATDDPNRPTVRQMMADHQNAPACKQCHKLVDPIGIALENFDRTGEWRILDAGKPINASDVFLDGTNLSGPADLRDALLVYSDMFVETLAERLMTYALGRGTAYQDMPVVRSIARDAAANNNRFSSIVMGIVKSRTFQFNSRYEDGR